ncbi:hypothetical protein [Listeria monocytogenes]|uniref:hypothetical protein n=1 Tax=Listeria monocytogenes TaxID=1639 RepID=UPI001F5A5A71|nr:hypothetical protein [Listeria monocytogenes]
MINELQKKIDEINYWDLLVLDIQSKYFGDEVYIYKVSYETDAKWCGDFKVRNTGPKSGYYAQDISLNRYAENEDFIECSFDASIMTMNIICKEIIVEEVSVIENSFFWKNY